MTAGISSETASQQSRRTAGGPALPSGDGTAMGVSFEFFPPKTEKMAAALWRALERLSVASPRFVSVTYGAGGSTRERTFDLVMRIQRETEVAPAAHLTCVDQTRESIDALARAYWNAGIRHLVALRGDVPGDGGPYRPRADGYAYAADLVSGLRRIADFEISVAAYPEVHPQASCAQFDLDNLKRKIDAGATRAITQFFFDNDCFARFVDRVQAAGITVPIVPGILPIANFDRMVAFAGQCGASVPDWLPPFFDGLADDPETHRAVAAELAAEQCRGLWEQGVRQFHIYTLNRADLTLDMLRLLNGGAQPAA